MIREKKGAGLKRERLTTTLKMKYIWVLKKKKSLWGSPVALGIKAQSG